eukprot:1753863-Lingulodinium_polyedra.AAC.1
MCIRDRPCGRPRRCSWSQTSTLVACHSGARTPDTQRHCEYHERAGIRRMSRFSDSAYATKSA